MLDLLGDLALLGFDLEGLVVAHRSGHQTNHALVRRLMELATSTAAESRTPELRGPDGALDILGVMSLLPHRYPFLLVGPRSRARAAQGGARRQECQH